jgi:polyisoprenoid-binding protein YceI
MKKFILSVVVLLMALATVAQTYKTRDGNIYFNPNKNQGNKESSEVALLVPMKSFHFNNALLEEHFNENYLHTNKFPNGTYKGKLIGFDKAMLTKEGTYNISSEGTVEMHGVTKPFKAPVVLTVKGGVATFVCKFTVKAADHNIEIPDLVKPKLADATPLDATINFKLN